MPILHDDRLAGNLDVAPDPKASLLRGDAIHQDVPFGKTGPRRRTRARSGIWLAGWNWTSNCLHKRQPAPRTSKG